MNKQIVIGFLVLSLILVSGFSISSDEFAALGTAVYSLENKSDNYFFSELVKFSDLSTVDNGVIWLMYKPERVSDTNTSGRLNLTINILRTNGTNEQINKYMDCDIGIFNCQWNETIFSLNKGDWALTSLYRESGNITKMQMSKGNSLITVESFNVPAFNSIADIFYNIAIMEYNILQSGYIFISLGFDVLMIIGIPVLIGLFFLWGVGAIKTAFRRLTEK